MPGPTQVAIRLGVDGAETVKRSFQDVGAAGTQAYAGIERAAASASAASVQTDAALDRQSAKWRGLAAQAKIAQEQQDRNSQFSKSAFGIGADIKSARDSAAAFEQLGHSAGLSAGQMNVLFGAVHHTADALISGASPVRVLAIEGVKLAGGLEAVGGGSLVAAGGVLAMGAAAAAAIAPVVILGVAATQGAADQAHLANALILTGRYAAESSDQVDIAARRIAASTGEGIGAANSALMTLVSSGQVSSKALEIVGQTSVAMAALTHQSAQSVAASFVQLAGDPARALITLQNQYHFLTQAQYEHIDALIREGDKTGATITLFTAFDKSLTSQTQQFGYLEQAIHFAGKELGNFWEYLKDFGKAAPLVEQAAQADALVAKLQAARAAAPKGFSLFGPIIPTGVTDGLDDAVKKAAAVHAEINADAKQAADAARHQDAIDAANALEGQLTGLKANHARALEEMKRYRDDAKRVLADPTSGPDARSNAEYALSHTGQLDKAIEKKFAGGSVDKHAEALARDSAALTANAAASLKAAEAYLVSTAAGQKAEAIREATVAATRKGTDVEARAAQQIAINDAKLIEGSAQKVAVLRDENGIRGRVNDLIASGALSASDANREATIEIALAPLQAAASRARGLALVDATAALDAWRKALTDANTQADRTQLFGATQAANDNIRLAQVQLGLADATNAARDVAIAKERALIEVERAHQTGTPEGDARVNSAVADARAQLAAAQAKSVADALRSDQQQFALSQASFALLAAQPAVRDQILERIKTANEAEAAGSSLDDVRYQKLLSDRIAMDDFTRAAERGAAVFQDAETIFDSGLSRFADNIAQGKLGWSDWADAARSAVQDVLREFIKLSTINPLENAIFGQNNPTLKDVGGIAGKILHPGQGVAAASKVADQAAQQAAEQAARAANLAAIQLETTAHGGLTTAITTAAPEVTALATAATAAATALSTISAAGGGSGIGGILGGLGGLFNISEGGLKPSELPHLPAFASGTNYAPGGPTRINEMGGEILNLPTGTQVIPHDVSMAMARTANGNAITAPVTITIDARGSDAAGLARLEAQIIDLKRTLPGTIVNTVNDGLQRRVIRSGGR